MIFDVPSFHSIVSLKLPPFSFSWRKIWQQEVCWSRPQSTITVSFSKKKKWPPQLLLSLFLFFVAFVLYGKLKWKESQIVFLQDEKRSSDRNSVYSKDASGGGGNQHIESSLPSSPAPPPRPLSSISTGRIHKASDFHSIFLLASLEEKNHIANWTDIGPEFDLFFRKKCICEDGSSSLHNRRRQWNNGTSATAQKSSTLAKTQPQQVRLICNKERIFTTEAASIAASNAFLECRWAFAYFCYFYPQNQRIEQKKTAVDSLGSM